MNASTHSNLVRKMKKERSVPYTVLIGNLRSDSVVVTLETGPEEFEHLLDYAALIGPYITDIPGVNRLSETIEDSGIKNILVVSEDTSFHPKRTLEDAVRALPENYVAIGHCYGPINPHGNDRVDYVISYELGWDRTDDPRALWRKEEHLRANKQLIVGIRVEWPVDEVVSIVKFDLYNKKAQVFTGRTFDPHPFFKDFDNTVCRTKMAIKYAFRNRIGGHLVAFYGNLKEEFKDFAKLIGFDVIYQ